MALTPGTRLGAYTIGPQIGVGGMGEVYRATDNHLGRDVAIKVLPEAFAQDAERLARFEREAKTLAALNHPNIAAVYGFEKGENVRGLVMELVEGPTLADRIAQGAMPVDEALPIAKQIAEALEAAHEQGIVHRDLKPANVKVRDDGTVKVLDFGLAKMIEGPAAAYAADAATAPKEAGHYNDDGPAKAGHYTMSPTITTPAMTQLGMILGTAAYMAPEQARGKPVDKRSDIWSFGAVVYEMLTGRRAFDGEDMGETLATVIKSDPEWTSLPADLPPAVRTLLRTCLQKDPRKRTVDATTALFVIDNASAFGERVRDESADIDSRRGRPLWRRALVPLAAVIITAAIALSAAWMMRAPAPAIVRTTIVTVDAALDLEAVERSIAITPDGSSVVYRGEKRLFVRALDRREPREVTVPGRPRGLFMSPDGQWIGYFESERGSLAKVHITGGPPVTIIESPRAAMRGATWGLDGTIIYGDTGPATGLVRVSATGGTSTVLTRPDRSRGDGDHVYPEYLPGGQAVLFTIVPLSGSDEDLKIAVLDLRTGTQKVLIQGGSDARYAPTGHLIYTVPGTLRAVGFDLDRLQVVGSPVPVLDGVATTSATGAQVAIASNGTMVYAPGGATTTSNRTLVWVDRTGKEEGVAGVAPKAYQFARISPDGSHVALDLREQNNRDIWVLDLARQGMRRLTFDASPDSYPVWTPDGRRIIYASLRSGVAENVYSQAADGGDRVVRLSEGKIFQQPQSITADGQSLVIRQGSEGTRFDLMLMSLKTPTLLRPLVATPAEEVAAELSPDGRWLAYQTRQSGAPEVMVRPFANIEAGPYQVSSAGGRMPLWARDSRELFYVAPDESIMGVRVEPGESFQFSTPARVLSAGYFIPGGTNSRSFDISPDGRRFLMIKLLPSFAGRANASGNLEVVQHWTEELKRLVPR